MEAVKSVVTHGPGDMRFREQRLVTPRKGEVIAQVEWAGLCGSDLSIHRGALRRKAGTALRARPRVEWDRRGLRCRGR